MKIALVTSLPVPQVYGGMDRLIEGLAQALRRRHDTDVVALAVDERFEQGVLKGYHDFYNLNLSAYDLVISCKSPSYMLRHPAHVVYLSHRMRVFYDLYQPRDAQHARMRRLIHWMDNWALSPQRMPQLFTIGRTVSRRLLRWGGLASTPIHPPTTFNAQEPADGEHFFAAGRLHEWKRFDLIIQALRASRTDRSLLIAGTGPQEEALRRLAGDDPRIRFLGHISEQRLRECYAHAIAAIFPPINEDLGLITFEAFLSGKPVITTDDSGEPAEIVRHRKTGLITSPSPEALAGAIDWIDQHPEQAVEMGRAGREYMRQVSWDRVVDALLDAGDRARQLSAGSTATVITTPRESDEERVRGKIRLLVTDNQIIDPPVGGGRIRIWELYRHMPPDFATTYVGTHDHPGPVFRDQWLAPNFREVIMPLTQVHFRMHELWRRATHGDATIDVTIPLLLGRCSPRYPRLIRDYMDSADILIGAHPWMFPFLVEDANTGAALSAPRLPLVYDSQNCEAVVKGQLLRRSLCGRYVLSHSVERAERLACRASDLVLACSPADADEFVNRYGLDRERLVLVPNGVDCERIRPGETELKPVRRRAIGLPEGRLALFVGSNYEPNLVAARFLIDELAPEFPDLTFAIVGGVGPMWIERYPDREPPPNVRLLGFVEDEMLVQLYEAADLGINPMTQGSGTNIKMLDYMSAGLPILTTSEGRRGLAGRHGEHWREATTGEFAPALREMNCNPDDWSYLGVQARKLAEQVYDWRSISADLADALRELVERRQYERQAAS